MTDGYDPVPYPSLCHPQTHPDWLRVLGLLFGVEPTPAPVERARILELGCACGGNLLPMAEHLPASRFVGIDRSRTQIDRAQADAQALGLDNLELHVADILELDPATLGRFDYIICHGVFSWVSRPVQDRILALLPALLEPRGLAVVSYNVYPGCHAREMVRQLMKYRTRGVASPTLQLAAARTVLDFVTNAVAARREHAGVTEPEAYSLALAREREVVRRVPDAYLFHEHLEPDNAPLYFHEFIGRVGAVNDGAGLGYVCDASLDTMVARDLAPATLTELAKLAEATDDPLAVEQYLDFVRNRELRVSVLSRGDSRRARQIQPAALPGLRFAMHGQVHCDDPTQLLASEAPVSFQILSSPDAKLSIGASDPLTKAALVELCAVWPTSVGFEQLERSARGRLATAGHDSTTPTREQLVASLIECMVRNAVVARCWEPPIGAASSARPRISAFNRRMAGRDGWLAALEHRPFVLEPTLAHLVPLLDGTRDHDALLDALAGLVETGDLTPRQDGEPIRDPAALRAALAEFLRASLRSLAQLPALMGDPVSASES
ncbi:methyltransferase regulatory domain-containing protein [Enhygromyxa salina]|uniref:tRNA (Guanine-N(7)-)-methyltransferase n=1 Tax=Enhygromyxa salina TaxID=215803 RepID=A0A2S9YYV3_9BACT|nr:class I SAM-dependent methyltransferase [Enhygromyxa salina]PRQ10252.1 hypothetical protein ENSA7_00610 [Enhygromyxa salina]